MVAVISLNAVADAGDLLDTSHHCIKPQSVTLS